MVLHSPTCLRVSQNKTRDFYITGESYASHYVPQLASLILNYNKFTNYTISLKGITVSSIHPKLMSFFICLLHMGADLFNGWAWVESNRTRTLKHYHRPNLPYIRDLIHRPKLG
ncbi:hypothetical protein Syun_003908 [Stephania yunnanensis]|uniref:Carboxypeptidase n=1 Tax=Stephania yunnanensis TaxID=152371 RepID=A0AAP0L2B6_9MAGN